tara:strand:+ start:569 stop:961 length:393 start_codon:yes stop_codon:yes gene_type:complete
MRYINVDDDFVGKILAANQLSNSEGLNESQEVEVVEEACEEGHVCPLCESELDAPISEEAMQECVDFILGTINEALEQEGEFLEESEDDSDEDLDEEYEVGSDEDEDEGDCPSKDKKKKKKKAPMMPAES